MKDEKVLSLAWKERRERLGEEERTRAVFFFCRDLVSISRRDCFGGTHRCGTYKEPPTTPLL